MIGFFPFLFFLLLDLNKLVDPFHHAGGGGGGGGGGRGLTRNINRYMDPPSTPPAPT